MPRAVAAILVALVAALILPTAAIAGKAQRFSDSATSLFCPQLESDAGTVSLSGWIGERGGTYLEFGYWPAQVEPWETQPTWVGYAVSTVLDGASVEVDFDVYSTDASGEGEGEEDPEPSLVGEATLSATFEPTGEIETFRSHLRDGNQQFRSNGSWEPLAVVGSLVLPGDQTFDVGSCDASNFTESMFLNDPTASTGHSKSVMVICNWSTDAGYVTFSAEDSPGLGTGIWLWIEGADGFYYSDGTGSLSPTALEASLDVFSGSEEADVPVGRANASAVLASGDRFSQTTTFGDSRYSAKGVWIIPDGSLTIELPDRTTTLSIDAEHCTASNLHWSKVPARTEHAPAVANDTPDAAIPLKLFDSLTTSTAGTADAPEAPCLLDGGDGAMFEGPITNTVWWRIDGTGAPITIDTAGSSFDTMVAIYVAEEGKPGEHIGCVDDVDESFQARMTFETAPDASYLIQTGGFDGQTGELNLFVTE